jgi:F0F1-type ATP synthase assembly protein I
VAEHFRQTEPKGEIVVVLQGIDADILKERKKAEKKAARKGWNVEEVNEVNEK